MEPPQFPGRFKDHLDLMVPQRFYTSGQSGTGDRHVYASRTRFIPNRLLTQFESRAWPMVTPGMPGVREIESSPVDLAARMRAMWR